MLYRPTRAHDALMNIFCEINAVKIDSVCRVSVSSNVTLNIRKRDGGCDDGVFTHAQGDIECHEYRFDNVISLYS